MSLREASRLSGVSHTHIRDIEDGRSIPSFAMVMRFLKAYTVDMEDFLRETGYLPANAEPEHMEDIKSIPVISWTQAGNWQEVCGTSQEDDYEEYVKTDTKGMILLLRLEACGLFLQACIAFVTCDFPFLSPIILCNTNFTTGSVSGEQVTTSLLRLSYSK